MNDYLFAKALAVVALYAAAAACAPGGATGSTPQLSKETVWSDCQGDAVVVVEEGTISRVLFQGDWAPAVKPGDLVPSRWTTPPPERPNDIASSSLEKGGPNEGRAFNGVAVHWTEDGQLRPGCIRSRLPCHWDAVVVVEDDTVLRVISQTEGSRPVKPGDIVRDVQWPPPQNQSGDVDLRGEELRGPLGGRIFRNLKIRWTDGGSLRSGCTYWPLPTPATR